MDRRSPSPENANERHHERTNQQSQDTSPRNISLRQHMSMFGRQNDQQACNPSLDGLEVLNGLDGINGIKEHLELYDHEETAALCRHVTTELVQRFGLDHFTI